MCAFALQLESLVPIAISCNTDALQAAIVCMAKYPPLRASCDLMLQGIAQRGQLRKVVFLLQHADFASWLEKVCVQD